MANMNEFTHFNASGEAHMVNVGEKSSSQRIAVAAGKIVMQENTLSMILNHDHKKGDVLGIARIAGIMGAKKTADLIPLCHPIPLTHLSIEFDSDPSTSTISCRCVAETTGQTGVEMEALCGVQLALLTIYDMCKAVDRGMQIDGICLLEKSGGASGSWSRANS